jgi:hypothetical protein
MAAPDAILQEPPCNPNEAWLGRSSQKMERKGVARRLDVGDPIAPEPRDGFIFLGIMNFSVYEWSMALDDIPGTY